MNATSQRTRWVVTKSIYYLVSQLYTVLISFDFHRVFFFFMLLVRRVLAPSHPPSQNTALVSVSNVSGADP